MCLGNMDGQDEQDKKLLQTKRARLMIGCAFVLNSVSFVALHGPPRVCSNSVESLRG